MVSGNQVTVTWSTGLQGYTLQSRAKVVGAQWVDVSQPPIVQNGQYVVTQGVGGPTAFDRLHKRAWSTVIPPSPRATRHQRIGTLTFAPGETQKTIALV